MNTKKQMDIEPYSEKYNGHYICSAMKGFDKKNPISGHEWSEYKVLKTFRVNVIEESPTPTRPAQGWSGRQFNSLKMARLEIDGAISLDFAIARIKQKNNEPLDGTRFEQTWRDRVLVDLAATAKESLLSSPEEKDTKEAKRAPKTGPGAA